MRISSRCSSSVYGFGCHLPCWGPLCSVLRQFREEGFTQPWRRSRLWIHVRLRPWRPWFSLGGGKSAKPALCGGHAWVSKTGGNAFAGIYVCVQLAAIGQLPVTEGSTQNIDAIHGDMMLHAFDSLDLTRTLSTIKMWQGNDRCNEG